MLLRRTAMLVVQMTGAAAVHGHTLKTLLSFVVIYAPPPHPRLEQLRREHRECAAADINTVFHS